MRHRSGTNHSGFETDPVLDLHPGTIFPHFVMFSDRPKYDWRSHGF